MGVGAGRTVNSAKPLRHVVVIGHPGAGKSVFCALLTACLAECGIEVTKIDTYAYLQGLFRRDRLCGDKRRFEPDPISEFVIKDDSIMDEALHLVGAEIRSEIAASLRFPIVELAFSERAALAALLNSLKDGALVHVDAPLDACEGRNAMRGRLVERSLRASSSGAAFDTDLDEHYVPPAFYDRYRANQASWDQGARLLATAKAGRRHLHVDNADRDLPAYEAACRALIATAMLPSIDRGTYPGSRGWRAGPSAPDRQEAETR